MGRKTAASLEKSKHKRIQRKENQIKISQSMAIIDKANKLEDPLGPFQSFKKFHKNGIEVDLMTKKCTKLDENTKQWAFDLTKQNMQSKYDQCSWGWDDKKKLEELTDEAAWYLIAKSNSILVGFSHFRFDLDDGIEVLYCYELQLEKEVQRKGLGKFMMQILELIAFTNSMKKVVLTVLKNNQYSQFFKAIKYELDESSPDEDDCPYEILSKLNKKLE